MRSGWPARPTGRCLGSIPEERSSSTRSRSATLLRAWVSPGRTSMWPCVRPVKSIAAAPFARSWDFLRTRSIRLLIPGRILVDAEHDERRPGRIPTRRGHPGSSARSGLGRIAADADRRREDLHVRDPSRGPLSDGRAVRPADVRRGVERVLRLKSPGAHYYAGILGTERCASSKSPCDLTRESRPTTPRARSRSASRLPTASFSTSWRFHSHSRCRSPRLFWTSAPAPCRRPALTGSRATTNTRRRSSATVFPRVVVGRSTGGLSGQDRDSLRCSRSGTRHRGGA